MHKRKPTRRAERRLPDVGIDRLISEGKDLLEEESYEQALERFREAFESRNEDPFNELSPEEMAARSQEIVFSTVRILTNLARQDASFVRNKMDEDEVIQEIMREARRLQREAKKKASETEPPEAS